MEADEAAEAERVARDRQQQEIEAARARKADAERTLAERSAEVDRIRTGRRANAERAVHVCKVERAERWQLRAKHQANRPGFWTRLRTFGAAGERWRHLDQWLADEIETATQELATAQREHATHSPRRSGCTTTACHYGPSHTSRCSVPGSESGWPNRQSPRRCAPRPPPSTICVQRLTRSQSSTSGSPMRPSPWCPVPRPDMVDRPQTPGTCRAVDR